MRSGEMIFTATEKVVIGKPVAEVIMDDLPPRWLKDALAAIEGLGCECC